MGEFIYLPEFGWENIFQTRCPIEGFHYLDSFSGGNYLLSHAINDPLVTTSGFQAFVCSIKEVVPAVCFMLSHAEKYSPLSELVSLMTLQQDQ